MRCQGRADDRGLVHGPLGPRAGGSVKRESLCGGRAPQRHCSQGCGGGDRLDAGLGKLALLDEGCRVWGHLTQCRETPLEMGRESTGHSLIDIASSGPLAFVWVASE